VGIGTKKDENKAYEWYKIAADSGDNRAKDIVKELRKSKKG
jgi:TPR repeat protein